MSAGRPPALTGHNRTGPTSFPRATADKARPSGGGRGGGASAGTDTSGEPPPRRFAVAEALLRRSHLRTAADGGLRLPRKRERLSTALAVTSDVVGPQRRDAVERHRRVGRRIGA